MGCLEEDPVCFGFIFFGAIFLLVGGGLCGSGTDSKNYQKAISGIVLLSLAGLLIVFGLTYYVVRTLRKRRKGRHRDKLKRRSRKKLAQLPLVVPVDKPVPHWIVQGGSNGIGGANGGAAVNPGLTDDFTDDEDYPITANHFRRQYPSSHVWSPSPPTQSTPRSPLIGNNINSGPSCNRGVSLPPYTLRQAKSSPLMYPSTSTNPLPVARPDDQRCYGHGRRNSIPFDLYDSNGQLRPDVVCHRPGCAENARYCERGRTGEGGSFFALVSMPNLRDAEHAMTCHRHKHQNHRYPEYRYQDHGQSSDGDPYHNWRHQRAYAVSPPVFV